MNNELRLPLKPLLSRRFLLAVLDRVRAATGKDADFTEEAKQMKDALIAVHELGNNPLEGLINLEVVHRLPESLMESSHTMSAHILIEAPGMDPMEYTAGISLAPAFYDAVKEARSGFTFRLVFIDLIHHIARSLVEEFDKRMEKRKEEGNDAQR